MAVLDLPASGFVANPDATINPASQRDDRYLAALTALRAEVKRLVTFLPLKSQANFTHAGNSGLAAL